MEYARIYAIQDEEQMVRAGRPETDAEKQASDRLHAYLEHVETHLSYVQATSLAGALAQIASASDMVDLFEANDTDERVTEKAERVQRLLYSARLAIEAASGLRAETFGGAVNMARDLDPRQPWLGEAGQ